MGARPKAARGPVPLHKYKRTRAPKWAKKPKALHKTSLLEMDKKPHFVYVWYSPRTGKVYVGYSDDPNNRSRQHRQEKKGGALKTKRMDDPNGRLMASVGSFMNWRDALQFEFQLNKKGKTAYSAMMYIANTLSDAKSKWGTRCRIAAGDERRLYPFHIFLFKNMPLNDSQRFLVDRQLVVAKKALGVTIHDGATSETLSTFARTMTEIMSGTESV